MPYIPDMFDSAPVWQAWVTAGNSKEERMDRLSKVPEAIRARVKSHVETVFAIRRFLGNQKTVKVEPRKRAIKQDYYR